MKKNVYLIALACLFFAAAGSLYSVGEKTIRLGGDSFWKMLDYRAGIAEVPLVRPVPVLALSSARNSAPVYGLDMALSFDEGNTVHFRDYAGHYRIIASRTLAVVEKQYSRAGTGAALFQGALAGNSALTADSKPGKSNASGPLVIEAQSKNALFTSNNHIYDFSLEFWMHPFNLENGEQILLWSSTAIDAAPQRILCVSAKNRLQWTFTNFFYSPDAKKSIEINIGGDSAIVPKTWSHHLIRFDSQTGMVEYLVDGKTESIEYATPSKHEGGEVYTPIAGDDGAFALGGSFSGMLDEFRIYGTHIPSPAVRKYPLNGGRIETRAVDLGEGSNGILKLEASGGKLTIVGAKRNNEFKRNGRFRFADDAEMQFFVRSSDNPYQWNNSWQPVIPGAELPGNIKGRYVQLAVDFYPSGSGEASPYLEEISITYMPDEPPLPPAQLTAVAMNGGVQLRWKNSPDHKTQGYLVYYGTSSGDYFGEGASRGSSPIDAGKQTTIYIDGLENGTLYYFRVAAYTRSSQMAPHVGEFSREVRARPLR